MTKNFKALIVCMFLSLWALALSAQGHWTFDYRQFRYDMTVYFSLQNGDAMVANPANYEVAAFVGGECRGVAVFEDQIGQNGVALQYGYLKIYSNVESGETVTLKCFDKDVAKERVFADVTVPFATDSHVGYPSTPVPLVLEYQVEAQSAYTDMGTVEGSGVKKSGISATITAVPNEGYKFVRWSNGMTGNPYSFIVEKDVSLTAEFAPKEYTFTFVLDNGQDNIVMKQDYKSIITAPTGLEKLGFTFGGWDTEVPATTPARDMTFTAQWNRNSYNLKFKNGEDVISDTNVPYEGDITIPTSPTKEGYTFVGWSPVIEMTMPAHDQVYTAQFSVNQYKVTFMANGEFVKNEYQDYGSAIVAPDAPTTGGYTFLGWKPEVDPTVPAHDVIYTASYDRNDYYATFIVDDVVKQKSQVTYGESITAPSDPEKEGYSFKGWQPAIPETMPDYDMAFTAKFEVNSYDVTWKVDDKTRVDQVNYLSAIAIPADPLKEGYTFKGWTPDVPDQMPASNQIFTAQFTINKYLVKFVVDEEIQEDSLAYGTAITATNPIKEGYTFTGWSPELPEGATVPARDVTYTAQFTVNPYTVTFLLGADTLSTTSQDYGSDIIVPNAPKKTGFTFKEWQPEVPATLPSHDVAFTAIYERNSYLSVFVVDGDTLKADSLAYEAKVQKPVNPEKVGYTFTGWQPEVLDSMPANDVTYTAQWAINQYTITFKYGNGSADSLIVQDYNTPLTVPADPARTGYTFAGWTPTVPDTIPAFDMSITAQWTPITYTISYELAGGALAEGVTNAATYTIESEAITLAEPTKTGYTFAGWTGTGLTKATKNVTIAKGSIGDRTYTATWTVNQYTMTFVLGNGEADVVKTQDYNSALTAPVPTKTGYTFKGWSPAVPEKVPAENKTFTAQWEVNKHHVIYVVNGKEWARDEVAYGDSIVLREYASDARYTFNGWVSDQDYKTMPDHDVTYTANITDGIETLFSNAEYVDVYTISGKLVGRNKTLQQVKQLQRGLYIVNGRRIIVK